MTDLDDIYSDRILELAANMPVASRLEDPDVTAKAHSKLCGSTVIVDLKVSDGVVTDYGHHVKACLLGQSAAAIMARNVVGSSFAELRQVARDLRAMLKENAPPPVGKWSDLEALTPVRTFPARHTSTQLVFEAVCQALDKLEAERADDSLHAAQ